MRAVIRWTFGVALVLHGVVHLLGALVGLGLAEASQLAEPIDAAKGLAWLLSGVLAILAGAMVIVRFRWWWALAAASVVVSQIVIAGSWSDAAMGTVADLLFAAAAMFGFLSQGPVSFGAEFRRLARSTTAHITPVDDLSATPVTDSDLQSLPEPVADYLRAVGAVGRPHVLGFRARISGRIRGGADRRWMAWTGEQVNTFGADPTRVLYMDATMMGLPTDVLHAFVGPNATMRVRVASVFPIVDAKGQEMDQAETVTLLNDLCVLAPAALVDAAIDWTPIDDHHARATFTNAGRTVSAELTFDDEHELVDFVSDDRLRASPDGRTFTQQRWSTPITEYRSFDGRRVGTLGTGCWHPPGEPGFAYLEFHVDDIIYLTTTAPPESRRAQRSTSRPHGGRRA